MASGRQSIEMWPGKAWQKPNLFMSLLRNATRHLKIPDNPKMKYK